MTLGSQQINLHIYFEYSMKLRSLKAEYTLTSINNKDSFKFDGGSSKL